MMRDIPLRPVSSFGHMWRAALLVCLCVLSPRDIAAQAKPEALKDFRIDGLVRFHNSVEAEATRERLVRAIWPDGLPKTRPSKHDVAKDAPELASINAGLLASAKRLDVDVSGFDWYADVYVVTPKSDGPVGSKLAIVHGGHMPEGPANYLAFGLSDSVNQLLRDGYVVAIIQMPLVAWNRDADCVIEGK